MSGRWADRPHGRDLPPGWAKIRRRILDRDPDCTLELPGCSGQSTEVDHIGANDDHADSTRRGACHPCHTRRTAQQAAAGRRRAAASRPRLRPTKQHPGIAT